jgi:ABC-type Fe3+-citrate transport system substrate-binding protein
VTEFIQGSYELRVLVVVVVVVVAVVVVLVVVVEAEAREQASKSVPVGDSHGKFVVEEELEVGL